ncbi:hypothetical protein [Paraburkholderia diazotrophica]|uniref:Uncharacterized protein n=1 Tax=Paraburkholderia diazotrophica TaxID=667676 RepID=A0A1H6QD87_9BURK|nr:hypothetical protein [Paraburkholderia diazotrophica]SEI41673.1 hypothetical protein SAMN05192539_1001270 [Paraburkholderia diazotrophica]
MTTKQTIPAAVLDALRFYAHGHHFNIDADQQQFDTVSGEPQNWLFSERDDDCTMIEDGSIARAALCGGIQGFEEPTEPVEGEVFSATPAAVAPAVDAMDVADDAFWDARPQFDTLGVPRLSFRELVREHYQHYFSRDKAAELAERHIDDVANAEIKRAAEARASLAAASEPVISDELHPDTAKLVRRFARSLANKLLAAQRKYGYSNNWLRDDWMDECRAELMRHVQKGDPRDVAAYCAFLWHHDASTTPVAREPNASLTGHQVDLLIAACKDSGFSPTATAVIGTLVQNVLRETTTVQLSTQTVDKPVQKQGLTGEQVDKIMEQAQVFASAWSLVGGVFDSGNALETAEEEKEALRDLLRESEQFNG